MQYIKLRYQTDEVDLFSDEDMDGNVQPISRDVYKRQPLSKEEIGYVYNSKVISPIIEDIKKKKYGSYLIGDVYKRQHLYILFHYKI